MHSAYVPLHLHTEYSLLDGAIKIDDLIAKALEYKLAAIAMTDHGSLFGAVEFYKKVSKAGLKPIIGCEVYIAPKSRFDKGGSSDSTESSFHLILLCKDINGYKNLTRLVSKAYLEGFYYKPRIDKDILSQHSGGLIGLSSCLKGEIPRSLSNGLIDKAREAALEYRRILGAENFFLEVQANGLAEQDKINKMLIELSRDTHIPLVATNDCHYLTREDAKAQDVLLCIQTGKTLNDTDRMRFSTDSLYFKSPEEMREAFKDIPEALSNTRVIAEKCNLDFTFNKFRLPKYEVPEGETVNNYLRKLAEAGLRKKIGGSIPDHYMERFTSELAMIEKMGFSSYFLIVWDFISYAKSRAIPVGPGRGSAAGSLVAYGLDITDIDPIKYGLLFERFLNPERVSMPDIDVDFCMDRRSEVIDYVSNRYGKDHVAQIITFGTMQARAVIRDVGRAMNVPYSEVDKVAKLVPMVAKITLKTAIEMEPKLKEMYDTRAEIKELIDVALRLEGLSRHASTHAAGIVISPEPLTDFLPLYKAPNDEAITTQFDMDAIKNLGLLKFDFLGLKTLTIIDKAEKIINDSHAIPAPANPPSPGGDTEGSHQLFSIRKIPLDDKATFDLLSSAKTAGIFQLESSGMKDLLTRLKPDIFEDLIALVALYRPGPLGSGMVEEFIRGKRGGPADSSQQTNSLAKLNIHGLGDILKETHGIILYQEQVMEIAHKLADFSLAQADILRKAMGSKNPEEMEKMKTTFIHGLKANKVSEKKAETLYNLILQFAQYGFNKSHSAAYALIAYQTAYLKAHYPVEFMAASLSADMDNTAKVVTYINECKEMGIGMLPPDINESTREFKVIDNSIRFGLEAVKGVGSSAIDAVLEVRASENFGSFFDFCSRVDSRRVNKKVIESLIKAGAMDSIGSRAQLMAGLSSMMESAMRFQEEKNSGQGSMFDMHQPAPHRLMEVEEWDESRRLMMEKEALGFYITGHPLNKYREKFAELSIVPTHEIQDLEERRDVNIGGLVRDLKQIQTRNKDLMAYVTIEDLYGTAEVIVFPEVYKDSQNIIAQDAPVVIAGYTDKTDKGLKVIAKKIVSIDDVNLEKELKAGGDSPNGNNRWKKNRAPSSSGLSASQYKKLVLTMHNTVNPETLPRLNEIFERYTGDCPVYLKIVSPQNWESVLSTNRQVSPSRELISEAENILGEGTVVLN
ncbi:MAG: DNA polymerase III subunit alpha [Nitrospiraceae bacterium]|nr:MAG: DNA polymerase III subunit alpha [Nitrospiraceae bacterium]